jgi:archaellum biogenesis ATPase FlaH
VRKIQGVLPHEARILRIEDVPSIWNVPGEFEWLIDKAVTVGSVNLLSAESGTGKSWVAYGLAAAVATGSPFAGLGVRQRPVVYFDGENPSATVKDRLKALGVSHTPELTVWGGWADDPPPGPDDARVLDFAQRKGALLIWDSLVEFNPGDEMNATETRQFMKKFRALANLGATILVLHHSGKSDKSQDYRGSSDIKASVDTAYKLETVELKDGKLHRLRLVNFKSRSAPGQNFPLEFHAQEGFKGFTGLAVAPARVKPNAGTVLGEILGEHGELNGTRIKEIAKGKYGVGKNAMEMALHKWQYQRKGSNGNTILYSLGPVQ